MKNHHLSNQCYDNYEEIVEKACVAWLDVSNNKELIKSIMHREWINLL